MKTILLNIIMMLTVFASNAHASTDFKVVESDKVCMVNDRYFGIKQIPIEVEKKTYYGCCAACKTRLSTETEVRYSKDPIGGEKVDKALAVIAANSEGNIKYFANQDNFKKFKELDKKSP